MISEFVNECRTLKRCLKLLKEYCCIGIVQLNSYWLTIYENLSCRITAVDLNNSKTVVAKMSSTIKIPKFNINNIIFIFYYFQIWDLRMNVSNACTANIVGPHICGEAIDIKVMNKNQL